MIVIIGGFLDPEFVNPDSLHPCYVPGTLNQPGAPWGRQPSHVRNPVVPLDQAFDEQTCESTATTKQAEGYNCSK